MVHQPHPQVLVLVPEVPQAREETTAHHLRTLGLTRVPTLAHQVLDKVLDREELVTMVPQLPTQAQMRTQALDLEHRVLDKVLVLDKEEPVRMVPPSQLRTRDQEQDLMPALELEHRMLDLEPEMVAAEQALQLTAVQELALTLGLMQEAGQLLSRMQAEMQAEMQLGMEMLVADQELAQMPGQDQEQELSRMQVGPVTLTRRRTAEQHLD